VQLTLVGSPSSIASCTRDVPDGYVIRVLCPRDEAGLADLYYAAYPKEIVADLNAAVEEMALTFSGEYGRVAAELSCVTERHGLLVSTIITVGQAPWPDTPGGPFVIEVITHPAHRRLGLAQAGLAWVARAASERGFSSLGLRVASENRGAVALYQGMGFSEWRPASPGPPQ
jgi:ribosomal protein S18 acetylase RimI-like enzyme